MPLRIISRREDQFLKALYSNGFDDKIMSDIINDPSFIGKFINLMISIKMRRQSPTLVDDASEKMKVESSGLMFDTDPPCSYGSLFGISNSGTFSQSLFGDSDFGMAIDDESEAMRRRRTRPSGDDEGWPKFGEE